MTDWPAFAGFTGVVLAILLLLARLSQSALDEHDGPPDGDQSDDPRAGLPGAPGVTGDDPSAPAADDPVDGGDRPTRPDGDVPTAEADRVRVESALGDRGTPTTAVLLANVAVSQGMLGTLLLAGAWHTGVPAQALGAGATAVDAGAAAVGVGLGAALYAANEAGAVVGRRAGFRGGEELRAALAPETTAGWAVLLVVVLPVIAGFEELLFRGALIGAMHAGFGVSPWLLAVGSSAAFAAGHGAQGRVGMLVTGTLGGVLAGAFVVTGSLLTVVVAHYLVNALEFLVHEWAGIDPAAGEWRLDR